MNETHVGVSLLSLPQNREKMQPKKSCMSSSERDCPQNANRHDNMSHFDTSDTTLIHTSGTSFFNFSCHAAGTVLHTCDVTH